MCSSKFNPFIMGSVDAAKVKHVFYLPAQRRNVWLYNASSACPIRLGIHRSVASFQMQHSLGLTGNLSEVHSYLLMHAKWLTLHFSWLLRVEPPYVWFGSVKTMKNTANGALCMLSGSTHRSRKSLLRRKACWNGLEGFLHPADCCCCLPAREVPHPTEKGLPKTEDAVHAWPFHQGTPRVSKGEGQPQLPDDWSTN